MDGFDGQEGRKPVKASEEDVVGHKEGSTRKEVDLFGPYDSFTCLTEHAARVQHTYKMHTLHSEPQIWQNQIAQCHRGLTQMWTYVHTVYACNKVRSLR